MGWKRARFGSHLTLNRDGSPREKMDLWMPPKMQILIPPDDREHARPFVLLEAENPDDLFVIVLNEMSIDGEYRGQTKRLVEL